MPVSLFAVFGGCCRVPLRFFVIALIVVMGCFVVMMGGRGVMTCSSHMMLRRWVFCHSFDPSKPLVWKCQCRANTWRRQRFH